MARLGSDAQLRVTPEVLNTKAGSVNKVSTRMHQQYNDLKNIINSTSSYWRGNGGEAHRKKFREQEKDVEDMFRRIKEHVTDLQKMSGVYASTEEKIKSTIQDSLPTDVII